MSDIPSGLPPPGPSPAPPSAPAAQPVPAAPSGTGAQPDTGQTGTGQSGGGQSGGGQAGSGQSVPQQPSPAPSGQAPPTQTAPPPPLPARAPALPPDLARAPAGTVVEGEVRASADGQVTVRTDRGDIRLDLGRAQAAQLLRPGTQVSIEIRSTAVQPPVVLVSPRGLAGAATTAPLGAGPAVTTGSAAAAPTVPLAVGRIVQATVVPGPASATTAAAPVPAGAPSVNVPAAPAAIPAAPAAASAIPPTTAAAVTAPPAPAATAPTATTPTTTAPTQAAPTTGAAPPAALASATAPAAPAASQATAPSPGSPPVTSASVTAPAPPTAQAAPPPPGTQVPSGVVRQAAPPPGPTPLPYGRAGPAAPDATGPASTGTSASPAADPAAQRPGTLPNGAVLTVRIAAIADAAARADGTPRAVTGLVERDAQSSATPRIAGQIAGVTAAGRPVVQSPVGFLALDARADLRLGTAIALDVLASRGGAVADRSAPLPVLAREWPALDAALRALEEQLGGTAAREMVAAMPRPGPQLTAALVFFMAALRGGDVRNWLGRSTVQALESKDRGGGLMKALNDDFQTLQRAAEPNDAGWRSFLIPIAWDERRPIRLLTRRERRDGRDGRSGKPGTAFLVDLDLTNIGPFRLDGLVRNELLDLLIRTTTPLPGVMRRDIKALMDGTLERTGIIGRLSFRASPVMPPLPVDLDSAAAGDTTTVTV